MSNHSQHSPILPCKLAPNPRFMRSGWVTQMASGVQVFWRVFFSKIKETKKKTPDLPFPPPSWISSFNFFWVVLPLMSVFDCSLSLVNSSAALSSDSSVLVADFSKSSRTTCQRSANSGPFQKLGRWSNFWIDLNVTGVAALSEVRAFRPPALRSHHWLASVCHHSFLQNLLLDPGTKTCENTRCSMLNRKNGSAIETLLVWTATLKLWEVFNLSFTLFSL